MEVFNKGSLVQCLSLKGLSMGIPIYSFKVLWGPCIDGAHFCSQFAIVPRVSEFLFVVVGNGFMMEIQDNICLWK